MNRKSFFVLVIVLTFFLLAVPIDVQAKGTVDPNELYLPTYRFKTNNITLDGFAGESGFWNFTVTTPDGATIWASWRQNGDDVHIVMASNQTGFIAVGWKETRPANESIDEVLNGSNVIIGAENQARDDTGLYGGKQAVDANLLDNIINSTVFVDTNGIHMEFTYPLQDSCPIDANITVGEWSYMIFATGSENSLNATFDLNTNAVYSADAYIGTWMDTEYYPNPDAPHTGLPFTDPVIVLFAIVLLPVIKKLKKN